MQQGAGNVSRPLFVTESAILTPTTGCPFRCRAIETVKRGSPWL